MKLLSIAIPSYNSQDYLEKCVKSLLPGGERVEIIIVDDGSTDRTAAIADDFAAEYPSMVKVVHQENGGHGAAINAGINAATGTFFKAVDSDDVLSGEFPKFLDILEEVEKLGGADAVITNYYYVHEDGKGDRSIDFSNALPQDCIFTWNETKHFKIDQILMTHAMTFRTEQLKANGIKLPRKTFYEDNYYVYGNLKGVERMYYVKMDLYLYTIGRAGQSVQEDVMIRRYKHQVKATELCFRAFKLDDVESRKKLKYLKHELFIMIAISLIFARLNGSPESYEVLEKMWASFREFDPKWEHRYHKGILVLLTIPGKPGRTLVRMFYSIAHKIVRFN